MVNYREQLMQGHIEKIKECKWVDTTAGLLESERARDGWGKAGPTIDTSSMKSFNFGLAGNDLPGIRGERR